MGTLRCVALERATLFLYAGQGEDGQARYEARQVAGYWTRRREGIAQPASGNLRGADGVRLTVFPASAGTGARYVQPGAWDGLGERSGAWTVRADGRDYVYPGWAYGEALPEDGRARRVVGVTAHGARRPGMRRLEIAGE